MGKRSDFERVERDFYPTPEAAVLPLLPHLPDSYFTFIEPCAGDGRLTKHLHFSMDCKSLSNTDIEPRVDWVKQKDAFDISIDDNVDYVITNPPWNRKFLHPFIEYFAQKRPTWLLFDADWMHTKQSEPYMKMCSKIVSIGRVKWIEGSKSVGKDNCCWYLFQEKAQRTQFYGRQSL